MPFASRSTRPAPIRKEAKAAAAPGSKSSGRFASQARNTTLAQAPGLEGIEQDDGSPSLGRDPSLSEAKNHRLHVAPGAPDDPLEQQAASAAMLVTERSASRGYPSLPRLPGLRTPDAAPRLPRIPRAHDVHSTKGSAAPASVHRVLALPGRAVSPLLREEMESRFGRSFGAVRLHSGLEAQQSTQDLRAAAYTVGDHIVFAPRRLSSGAEPERALLAHELTHVVQQSEGVRVVQRAPESTPDGADPWDKLSAPVRKQAEELWEEYSRYTELQGSLNKAQTAHHSDLRGTWINALGDIGGEISAVDSDSKFAPVKTRYENYTRTIEEAVTRFTGKWNDLERNCLEEVRFLRSHAKGSLDFAESAKYLEEIYTRTKHWMDGGALDYVTDEDYAELKAAFGSGRYVLIGSLRGARIRVKQMEEMLDTVADLIRNREEAEKFVPHWHETVSAEIKHLDAIASRSGRDMDRNDAVFFAQLRDGLQERLQGTLQVKPRPEESTLEKAFDLTKGVVEGFTGMFIEAAKQVVDLAQIGLHFVSFGHYDPHFISATAEAAEQGATTKELLVGMVTGLIDAPKRFLQACRDGDWQAIGREGVNLYMLAELVRKAPEIVTEKLPKAVKRLPEFIEKTRASLRILKARVASFELAAEGRTVPPAAVSSPPAGGVGVPSDPGHAPAAPPATSRPVRGFRSPNDPGPTPSTPPAQSPPVRGFRSPNDPGPAPNSHPEPIHLRPPSRPVAGFGRKLAPGDASPGPAHQGGIVTDMPPARQMPNAPQRGGRSGAQGARASAGDPPGKPAAPAPADPVATTPASPTPATAKPAGPAATTPATPTPAGPAAAPSKAPATAMTVPVDPLLTPEDLNKPVPQAKGVSGDKRMLTRPERATANKVLGILRRVNSGEITEQAAHAELGKANLRVQALQRQLAGWTEIDLMENNPGALNQMRIIYRIAAGKLEAKVLQIH